MKTPVDRIVNTLRRIGGENSTTIWSVTSLGVMALSGLILLALLRYDSTETLGVFNQVYALFIILSQVGVGGIQNSVLNYVSRAKMQPEQWTPIVMSALILVSGYMILVVLSLWALAEPIGSMFNSPNVGLGIKYAAPGLLFFGLNKVLINFVNGINALRANAFFRALRFAILPLVVAVLIFFDASVPLFSIALTVTEIVVFLSLVPYAFYRLHGSGQTSSQAAWMSKHISFGLRGMLSGVLLELNTRIDIIMLGFFVTDAEIGIYSFAATMAEAVAQIPVAVRWRVDPQLGAHFALGEFDKIVDLAKTTRQKLMPWMGLLVILSLIGFPLLAFFIDGSFNPLEWVLFAVILVGVLIGSGYRPLGGLLLQGGLPDKQTGLILLLVLSDALLNLAFIPALGVMGAAVVTSGTYILEMVFIRRAAKKYFGMSI